MSYSDTEAEPEGGSSNSGHGCLTLVRWKSVNELEGQNVLFMVSLAD